MDVWVVWGWAEEEGEVCSRLCAVCLTHDKAYRIWQRLVQDARRRETPWGEGQQDATGNWWYNRPEYNYASRELGEEEVERLYPKAPPQWLIQVVQPPTPTPPKTRRTGRTGKNSKSIARRTTSAAGATGKGGGTGKTTKGGGVRESVRSATGRG